MHPTGRARRGHAEQVASTGQRAIEERR